MATAGTMRVAAPHTLRPVYNAESPQKTSKPSMPIKFNPEKHVSFNTMPKRLTMQDLGLPTDQGISPIAVSEPFPLFTAEAVQAMRDELLSDDVWENCRSSSKFAPCQLRGMAPRYVLLPPYPLFLTCFFNKKPSVHLNEKRERERNS